MSNGIEWVINGTTAEGVKYRGVQVAMYGHPAIDFFAKRIGELNIVNCPLNIQHSFV